MPHLNNATYNHTIPNPLPSKRILVAEEDEVNRWFAARLLEQKGYNVSTVTNGQAALAAFAEESFDLILLDLQMPVMNGLETTSAIRQQESRSKTRVPIIAFTNETVTPQAHRYWKAGIDCYLSKPIHTEEFYRRIEAVLKLNAQESRAEKKPAIFDCEEALARIKGNLEILQSVAEMFFTSSIHLLSAIRRAIAKEDPYNLDFAAHRLKGTASTLSAHQVVALAERLELMGSIRNLSCAQTTLGELEKALAEFKAAYEAKFPPSSSPPSTPP